MPTCTLDTLPDGTPAEVCRLEALTPEVGPDTLRRLAELGFLPGEPVWIERRGPGGREPLAVHVGSSLFALRLAEARCVQVLR